MYSPEFNQLSDRVKEHLTHILEPTQLKQATTELLACDNDFWRYKVLFIVVQSFEASLKECDLREAFKWMFGFINLINQLERYQVLVLFDAITKHQKGKDQLKENIKTDR